MDNANQESQGSMVIRRDATWYNANAANIKVYVLQRKHKVSTEHYVEVTQRKETCKRHLIGDNTKNEKGQ